MADDTSGKTGMPVPSPSMGEAPLPPHIIRGCVCICWNA